MTRMKRASDGRAYRCPMCDGIVKAARKQTLDGVRVVHEQVCAGKGRGPGR